MGGEDTRPVRRDRLRPTGERQVHPEPEQPTCKTRGAVPTGTARSSRPSVHRWDQSAWSGSGAPVRPAGYGGSDRMSTRPPPNDPPSRGGGRVSYKSKIDYTPPQYDRHLPAAQARLGTGERGVRRRSVRHTEIPPVCQTIGRTPIIGGCGDGSAWALGRCFASRSRSPRPVPPAPATVGGRPGRQPTPGPPRRRALQGHRIRTP